MPAPAIPLPVPEGMKPATPPSQEENLGKENAKVDEHPATSKSVISTEKETFDEQQSAADNFVPLADSAEALICHLDQIELRVEQLRETAAKKEAEKEEILLRIGDIRRSGHLLGANDSDGRDELLLNAVRVLCRCRGVNVVVETPRDQHQQRALQKVNEMIENALKTSADGCSSDEKIKGFLNACHADELDGHIDEKFQSAIIECTADDQKKIRRKLAQIINQKMDSKENGKN